jgi:hypothetical protein
MRLKWAPAANLRATSPHAGNRRWARVALLEPWRCSFTVDRSRPSGSWCVTDVDCVAEVPGDGF